ncbi:MAG: peptidylprolyl isomerase, partial [Clostridia bacterium]|nr:peptidylprolyl isomerase [Clostridia bacterium]
MNFKKLGRAILTLAVAGAALAVPFASGCTNSHPEAEIKIEFMGKSYVLEYKMYRNMYPQTVKHFIELADQNFYDNTIIHNYENSYWYGGGYSYAESETEGELSYKAAFEGGVNEIRNYLDDVSKEKAYFDLADPAKGLITPSVYRSFHDGKPTDPLRTLIGEFSSNQHKINKGALKASFGSLRMNYSSKTDDKAKSRFYLDKTGSAAGVMGEYRYNSTTSLFTIQTGTSTSTVS